MSLSPTPMSDECYLTLAWVNDACQGDPDEMYASADTIAALCDELLRDGTVAAPPPLTECINPWTGKPIRVVVVESLPYGTFYFGDDPNSPYPARQPVDCGFAKC